MQDAIYEAITDAQKAEALENAAAILCKWHELQPLSKPLERKRREITARYEKAATSTDESTDSRQQGTR
jgi:DNA-binding LytR/AlgR family response regulator